MPPAQAMATGRAMKRAPVGICIVQLPLVAIQERSRSSRDPLEDEVRVAEEDGAAWGSERPVDREAGDDELRARNGALREPYALRCVVPEDALGEDAVHPDLAVVVRDEL